MNLAKKAISLDELNPLAYVLLANTYAKTRQFEKAITAGKKAISLDPANSNINALYCLALNGLGKFREAIPFLKKAIRTDPKHPSWYLAALGAAYYNMGQFKEAISFLKKAIRTDAEPRSYYLSDIGWAYFYTGQNEKAIAAFEEYVSRDPENPHAHAFLGCALIAAGKPEKADTMLEKALSLNFVPGWFSWFSCNLAIARFGTGQHEKEITMMRELSNSYPLNATVQRLFALALIFEGKYNEALSMAKEAVRLEEISPGPAPDALFYQTLGLSYLMMGQYEDAIAAFRKAINIWPEYLAAHVGLAAVCSLAGRMEEAYAQVAKVLRLNPEITLEDIDRNGYFNYKKAGLK